MNIIRLAGLILMQLARLGQLVGFMLAAVSVVRRAY